MARKPLRPCKHPGCPELTSEGWCLKHKTKSAPRLESAQWHGWYFLPIWVDDLRPTQLMEEPFCRECEGRGFRVYATEVDHVRPHRGVWALFIDRTNLQSLCKRCHSSKTMQEIWSRKKTKN